MKFSSEESRIDLNDLLRRAQEKKRQENKVNIIVVGTACSAAIAVLLILTF